jgi:chemosensory pili system protein ChpA (sensor histidine kinase/response regulator)
VSLEESNSSARFLDDASERLQFVREYAGVPFDPQSTKEDLARLHQSARMLVELAAGQGFPLFTEIAGKLAHVFQYACNTKLSADTYGPLTEFISDAVTVLEFDLLKISADSQETVEDIEIFKRRYSFAFPQAVTPKDFAGESGSEHPEQTEHIPGVFAAESAAGSLPDDEEVPKEVFDFFIPEAEEHLQVATECLLAIEAAPNSEDINRLFRSVHTIKGSASQVGLRRLGSVAHRLEDLIGQIRDGSLAPSPEIVDACLQTLDALRKFLHQGWTSEEEMYSTVRPLLARIAEWAPAEEAEGAEISAAATERASTPETFAQPAALATTEAGAPAAHGGQAKSVRISLQWLDELMNGVGELVINRTRLVGRMTELRKLVEVLWLSRERLTGKIAEFQDKYEFNRIGSVLRSNAAHAAWSPGASRVTATPADSAMASEFSELELDRYDDFNILSRSLTEISADVSEVLSQLGGFMGRVGGDIGEFTKLAHHLQDEITQARMVSIGNLYTRLSRTARDAAKVCEKQVDLELEGANTQLDSNIVQHITDPLVHLVRNAIAHGVESPAERQQTGKPLRAKVVVRAFHRGNHVFIEIEDDGRGLNYENIRRKAVESGFVPATSADQLGERELRSLLFQPGFSTADSMTEIAGRGVGLDVVRNNVLALNGEIEIRSEAGKGTCFVVKLPLTLIISQALFVRLGTTVLAMPLSVVEEIRRLRPDEIEDVGGKLLTKVRGVVTEIVRLDSALGLPPLETMNGFLRMVIVRVTGRQIGVVVEEVLGKDEVVIKNFGEFLRRIRLFPGATISTDGSLILLIDVNRLVSEDVIERGVVTPTAGAARVFAPGAAAVASGSIPAAAVDDIQGEKVVVVADDSISVRKFVGRMLEKAGYRVKLASDGMEAAELIAQVGCHLLISDIEMPRMNGYELMTQLRQDPSTRRIPVMVVTSRAGAKHRERAMQSGAVAFLTKPVQEEQLVAAVTELIGSPSEPQRMFALATDEK